MQSPLKIIFAGTPEIAANVLNAMLAAQFIPQLILTKPDTAGGRGQKIAASPVKRLALIHHIPVLQPTSLKQSPLTTEQLTAIQPDIMIVVAYGLILPEKILTIPHYGCINIHMSLLPQHRGAAPIERAILAGDILTGITIMQMDSGLDSGDIIVQKEIAIDNNETSGSLANKLTTLSCAAIVTYLHNLQNGKQVQAIKQAEHGVSYASKINKIEAQINWSESANTIERKIRGFNPHPGCFSYLNGTLIKIWQAHVGSRKKQLHISVAPGTIVAANRIDGLQIACGENSILEVDIVQLAGKSRQTVAEFLCGYRNLQNCQLYSETT